MIDHISVDVSDLKKSGHFYDNALKTLGYKKLMEAPLEFGGRLILGWVDSAETELYIGEGIRNEPRLHIAFRAENHKKVDEFYKAALAAGGKDNGKPGLRTEYHENYYGAFILDPDGHNIEAVCHDSHDSSKTLSASSSTRKNQ
jgi:catechol 2,3-dioxygenase-like lactoylglutathione lyase family enzyme